MTQVDDPFGRRWLQNWFKNWIQENALSSPSLRSVCFSLDSKTGLFIRHVQTKPMATASGALVVFEGRARAYGVKLEIRPVNTLYYFVFLTCLSNAKFPLTESHFDWQVVQYLISEVTKLLWIYTRLKLSRSNI
jgi:hypothetical protein